MVFLEKDVETPGLKWLMDVYSSYSFLSTASKNCWKPNSEKPNTETTANQI